MNNQNKNIINNKNEKNEAYVTLTLLCTKCKFEWDLLRKCDIKDMPPDTKNYRPLCLVFTKCPICNTIDYMPIKKTWKP